MTAQLNQNTLLFLLTAIGLIVLPHVGNLPVSVFSFFALLLGWRLIVVWKPKLLPGRLMLLLLTVIGIALLYFQHQGFLGRDAGTRLFVLALGLKLMEIKSSRDLYLITFLAFIVAASQFLYQQSILMAAYIVFVSCVLLATLVCINSSRPQTWLALKTAGVIILQAIPMAVVIFILFPRVAAPRWMYFNDQHQAKTGLSDTMEPGSINSLMLSDELVFRVKFIGAIPPPAQRYWRGPVLSFTDGKKWSQAADLQGMRLQEKPKFSGPAYQYTLLMEPQQKNWVFALDMPIVYSDSLRLNANYQLLSSVRPDKRAEYQITSYPGYQTGAISNNEYNNALQMPDQPAARITQLVKQLHGFDGQALDFINLLLNHFRTENFHYTLSPPLLADKPIESFLFDNRYGFCSHYASAFVYLMRVAGIPARVVTGYQGGELNIVGNFLDIRQAHAHAWAEVWLPGKGWLRFDPTAAIAPERIERDLNIDQQIAGGIMSFVGNGNAGENHLTWLKQIRQFWGNVDYNWQRWVINYDNTNQSNFLASLGIKGLKTMMLWLVAIIALITALLSWGLFRGQRAKKDPVLISYEKFCKKLRKHGLHRQIGEGANAFAERVKGKLPQHKEQIEQITTLFIKLHYGKNAGLKDARIFYRLVAHLSL
ncbi:MAG: DUF3488 and transglutaminase-like domain-containing protein [Methylococcales bacterium]